jgi:hypothetical protein
MKLNHYNRKVFTVGGETTAFTATMNGAAFAILSDAIYQHKLAAIVRELSCNAYDSHVEAGKADVPFTIALPNHLSSNLIISDEGVGLDDIGVRKVFASYFNSTKTNSNDVTGGMGIGAKSVFSYSNSFTIVARKDGVERVYNAFIGEAGVPQVQIVSHEDTEEKNGVSIYVPIKEQDYSLVEAETSVIASMFKTIPNVTGKTGFKLHCTDVYEQIEKYGYARINRFCNSQLYSSHKNYALMCNVIYPLPASFANEGLDLFLSAIASTKEAIVIPFNVGDLTPAASRESLSLNEKTTKVVVDTFNAVSAKAKSEIQEELKNFDHPVPAYRYLVSRVTTQFASGFKFRGKDISRVVTRKFKFHRFCILKTVFYPNRGYKPRICRQDTFTLFDVAARTRVVVYQKSEAKSPSETKRNAYFKDYVSNNNISEMHSTIFLEFSRVLSAAQRKRLENYLQVKTFVYVTDAEVKKFSDSNKAPNAGRKQNSEKTDTTIYCKVIRNYNTVDTINNVDVSEPGVSYYWIDCDPNEENYIAPKFFSTEGSEVRYILKNKINASKIEKLGILGYTQLTKNLEKEKKDEITKYLTYKKLDTVLCFSQTYGGTVTVSLRSQTKLDKIYSVSELVKKRLEPILDRVKNFYAQNKDLFSKMDRVFVSDSDVVSRFIKLDDLGPLKVFTDAQAELDTLTLQYADALDIISRIPVYNQDQEIIKRIVDLIEELEYHRSNAANPNLNLKAA